MRPRPPRNATAVILDQASIRQPTHRGHVQPSPPAGPRTHASRRPPAPTAGGLCKHPDNQSALVLERESGAPHGPSANEARGTVDGVDDPPPIALTHRASLL